MSDNRSDPTSMAFMDICACPDVDQAFTRNDNTKGNADTERMMRTMMEEWLRLTESCGPTPLATRMAEWVDSFIDSYMHMVLGYRTPN